RPHQQAIADELMTKWKAWKAGGALTSEMETAALFIVGATLGVRCGAVLTVLWNADNDKAETIAPDAAMRGVVTAVEALRLLIARDKA
ncbi:MAG: uridine phosphorylase, partial [Butyricicoccus sp.]